MTPEFRGPFESLIASANRANVTIYCVDPSIANPRKRSQWRRRERLEPRGQRSAVNATKRSGAVTRSDALVIEHAEQSISLNQHLALSNWPKIPADF